jgi:hypothetical protein
MKVCHERIARVLGCDATWKMREGPSEPAYRRRLQTTLSCSGKERLCRKDEIEASRIITYCDLCSQGIELLHGSLGAGFSGCELSFANRVHDFYARNRTARRPKRLKPKHRTRKPFHCSMVLLDEIIEIFRVADHNRGLVRLVVVLNRCRVAPTLIDGEFLRQSLSENGLT